MSLLFETMNVQNTGKNESMSDTVRNIYTYIQVCMYKDIHIYVETYLYICIEIYIHMHNSP